MTDREKLVDLLEAHCAVIGEENCKAAKGEKCTLEDCANCLADHLIAHGVTVREPQKPMRMDELKAHEKQIVWLEVTDKSQWMPLMPAHLDCVTKENAHFDCIGSDEDFPFKNRGYNVEWRCWAEKPTEEERKAAKWE